MVSLLIFMPFEFKELFSYCVYNTSCHNSKTSGIIKFSFFFNFIISMNFAHTFRCQS